MSFALIIRRAACGAGILAIGCLALAGSASAAPALLPKVPLSLDSGHSAHGVQVGMDARGDAVTLFNITQTGVTNAQTVETDDRFAGLGFGNFTDMSQGPIQADTVGSFDGRLAVDGAGDAAAIWSYQQDPAANAAAHTIRLRTRVRGGDWGSPVDVSVLGAPVGEDAEFPSVAVDGAGTPTAAWQDNLTGHIRAVTRSSTGAWPTPQILNPSGPSGANPAVATDALGDRAVAWRALVAPDDQVIAVNMAPVAASTFAPQKTLTNSRGKNVVSNPGIALSATGTATIVWGEGTATGSIDAADVPLGGNPSPTTTVSGTDDVQGTAATGFAMNARGDAVAIWATAGAIRAALRPAGQPWELPADRVDGSRRLHRRSDQRGDRSLRRRACGLERR